MAEATRPADLIVVDQLDLFRGDRVPKHFIDKILGEARGRGAASPVVRAIPARKQTARMPSVKTDRLPGADLHPKLAGVDLCMFARLGLEATLSLAQTTSTWRDMALENAGPAGSCL